MARSTALPRPAPEAQSQEPLQAALAAVGNMPDPTAAPLFTNLPEATESFSFLKYIPSPQEEYEHLYKVFTEAEGAWE